VRRLVGRPPSSHLARNQAHAQHGLGELAQLGERLVCNQEVTGSSPVFSNLRPPELTRERATVGRPTFAVGVDVDANERRGAFGVPASE
jgi:hypothetical protein